MLSRELGEKVLAILLSGKEKVRRRVGVEERSVGAGTFPIPHPSRLPPNRTPSWKRCMS
jgi:hypothetical protein